MARDRRRAARVRAGTATAVGMALLVGGCTSDWDAAPVFDHRPSAVGVSTLRAVADCDDLVEQSRTSLAATVQAQWAWTDQVVGSDGMDAASGGAGTEEFAQRESLASPSTTAAGMATDESTAPDTAASSESAPDVIGTNTQEADVDEADIVKTDGRRVVALVDGVLRVVVLDEDPGLDGSLAVQEQSPSEMFLRGDEVVLVGSGGPQMMPMTEPGIAEPGMTEPGFGDGSSGAASEIAPTDPPQTTTQPPSATPPSRPVPPPFQVSTTVTVVSIAEPTAPAVTGSTTIEGSYVSSRMVGGRIRLVVRGEPQAANDVAMAMDEQEALEVVESLEPEALLPRRTVGAEIEPLGTCGDVMVLATESEEGDTVATTIAPGGADSSFSPATSISTITALTVGEDLDDLQPTTIQGNAETVYASTDALYVTASGWDEGGTHTQVHRFSLPADGPATHTGSGRAPGMLLNQFSLSERGGALRVVTTLDGSNLVPGRGSVDDVVIDDMSGTEPAVPVSQGRLTVLDTEGDTLDEIGHLDGLGPGEQVKSVRFVEELAYVVTFRTTDPLYALDLSDPRAPRLLGELKIPGFSEYLHPVGDGLLLGVGREADPRTGADTGFKVSLFDISDPAAMAEVDQLVLRDATSPVSGDHRAFLWDAGRRQAVLPVEAYGRTADSGALVLRVSDGRLQQVATLHHDGWGGVPIRSFVVGDELWTLSAVGLARTSADAPGPLQELRF